MITSSRAWEALSLRSSHRQAIPEPNKLPHTRCECQPDCIVNLATREKANTRLWSIPRSRSRQDFGQFASDASNLWPELATGLRRGDH